MTNSRRRKREKAGLIFGIISTAITAYYIPIAIAEHGGPDLIDVDRQKKFWSKFASWSFYKHIHVTDPLLWWFVILLLPVVLAIISYILCGGFSYAFIAAVSVSGRLGEFDSIMGELYFPVFALVGIPVFLDAFIIFMAAAFYLPIIFNLIAVFDD